MVGEGDMVAHDRVMADMGSGHKHAALADPGQPAADRGSPIEGAVFADEAVLADLEPYRLTLVAAVLRITADDAKRMDCSPGTHHRILLDHDMAEQTHVLAELHTGSDHAPGSDLDPVGQDHTAIDHGCGVNAAHDAADGSTVTIMAANSASDANLPSMNVSPRNLKMSPRTLVTTTCIRS